MPRTTWAYEPFQSMTQKVERLSLWEADLNTNVDVQKSYNESISSSNLVNKTDNYDETNTKNSVIRNYVNNLINRNNDETNYETNMKENLQNVSETNQENELTFSAVGAKDLTNIKINQSNSEIANLCASLDSFTQDVKNLANSTTLDNTSGKTTDSSASGTNTSTNKTGQGASSDQTTSQSTGQSSAQEAKTDSFKRYERTGILGQATANINVNWDDASNITKTYTNEQNEMINKVINNTETNDIINNAYENIIETVKKVNQTVSKETSAIQESRTKQSNKLSLNFDGASGLRDVEIKQINTSLKTVKTAMILSDIMSSSIDDTTKAVMLDMLNATSSFDNKNTSENETSQTTENKQTSEQKVEQVSKQTAKTSAIASTIVAVVLLVVAAFVIKRLAKGWLTNYHPLYNRTGIKPLTSTP